MHTTNTSSWYQKAKKTKEEMRQILSKDISKFTKPPSPQKDCWVNPIARFFKDNDELSMESKQFIKDCMNSPKLVLFMLEMYSAYFEDRKKMEDKIGRYYRTLTFPEYLLRLYTKRFPQAFYDGSLTKRKSDKNRSRLSDLEFFKMLGTEKDTLDQFKDYLTLEETVFSQFIIPQAVCPVIGTGARLSNYQQWDPYVEFNNSIYLAVFNYPAGAEFRDGRSLHYSTIFITKPKIPTPYYQEVVKRIQSNQALLNAAKIIYGNKLAFECDDNDKNFIEVGGNPNNRLLFHPAPYKHYMKNTFKLSLLSFDAENKDKGLGKTIIIKALGLRVFGFDCEVGRKKLEEVFMQALYEVVNETAFYYINCINLVNFHNDVTSEEYKNIFDDRNLKCRNEHTIRVIRTVMAPSSNLRQDIGEIGGVIICGDSASIVGNEGNTGTLSSDDSATLFTFLRPDIMDPEQNPKFKDASCIYVVTEGKMEQLIEKFSIVVEKIILPQKIENSSNQISETQIITPIVTEKSLKSVNYGGNKFHNLCKRDIDDFDELTKFWDELNFNSSSTFFTKPGYSMLLAQDAKGNTPLHYAAKKGHQEVIFWILTVLENDKNAKEKINTVNNNKQTPLMCAVLKNRTSLIDDLLNCGADPTILDSKGHSPLYYACANNNAEMLNKLITIDTQNNVLAELLEKAKKEDLKNVIPILETSLLKNKGNKL